MAAGRWAATWAERMGAHLTVIGVHGTVAASSRAAERRGAWAGPRADELLREFNAAVADISAEFDSVVVNAHWVVGTPAGVLIARSTAESLVVVGRTGLGRVAPGIGSVAAQVVNRAPGPVVVVPPEYATDGPIVVGADPTQPSPRALAAAWSTAAASGRSVRVVMCRSGIPQALHGVLADHAPQDTDARVRSMSRSLMRAVPGVEATFVLCDGAPIRLLLGEAADASLLVVARRNRDSGPLRSLGSVARHVVLSAPSPTLVL